MSSNFSISGIRERSMRGRAGRTICGCLGGVGSAISNLKRAWAISCLILKERESNRAKASCLNSRRGSFCPTDRKVHFGAEMVDVEKVLLPETVDVADKKAADDLSVKISSGGHYLGLGCKHGLRFARFFPLHGPFYDQMQRELCV